MSVTDGLGKSLPTSFLDGQVQILKLMSVRALAGDDVLTQGHRNIQRLDPGGAGRNVDLPAEANGLWFVVANAADAAETLTVRDDAGATVVAVAQDQAALVWCDGTSWYYIRVSAPA